MKIEFNSDIEFNEELIIKRIEKNAFDAVVNKLVEQAKETFPKAKVYRNWYLSEKEDTVDWNKVVDNRLDEFLKEHKDEIIEKAVDKLSASYIKTKAFKEKFTELIELEKKLIELQG